jgi:hypothetical protein
MIYIAFEGKMKRTLLRCAAGLLIGILSLAGAPAQNEAGSFSVASPDGRISVTISVGAELSYAVSFSGRQILQSSPISMTLDTGKVLGRPAKATGSGMRSFDQVLHPVVKYEQAEIPDRYNGRRVDFEGDLPCWCAYSTTALLAGSQPVCGACRPG